ncbi:chromosome segregation protein SMC [Aquifex aeolicus]|uniref:chromosome segregation protein SMC n=1 Tax=Aquifex aeolicus TaxID=63363 RepID=UPI00031C1E88|nr:chromosome segregation protein SMC [Aquifex aeolicus]
MSRKRKAGRKKKQEFVRTTISLPKDLWEELRIESVKKKTPLGKLIAQKIELLKKLQKKYSVQEEDI